MSALLLQCGGVYIVGEAQVNMTDCNVYENEARTVSASPAQFSAPLKSAILGGN